MAANDDQLMQVLRDLESEVRGRAEVAVETYEGTDITSVHVHPRAAGALSLSWTYIGDDLILAVGQHGGRWELELIEADVTFLVEVVRSVMAGRVRETFGHRRSRVEVTLADGTSIVETGYSSLLPTPGWLKRGPVVHYRPY